MSESTPAANLGAPRTSWLGCGSSAALAGSCARAGPGKDGVCSPAVSGWHSCPGCCCGKVNGCVQRHSRAPILASGLFSVLITWAILGWRRPFLRGPRLLWQIVQLLLFVILGAW